MSPYALARKEQPVAQLQPQQQRQPQPQQEEQQRKAEPGKDNNTPRKPNILRPNIYSMDNPTAPEWDLLDMNEIIKISIDNVLVDWIGHPGHGLSPEVVLAKCNELGVESRQLKVGTREVWQNEIENNGYVVDYHDGKGNPASVVTDLNAVHYTLQEYGAKYGAKYSSNPKYRSETGDILVSAFDTFKNKRVIVDGIHRVAVMSSKYSSESDYSKRIVYEWYGNRVKEIFTYDFSPFYRDNTRASIS